MSTRASSAGEDWTCPRCEGGGFVLDEHDEAVACSCREARIRFARSAGVSSVIPRKYRGVSFERAPVTELSSDVLRPVQSYVREVERNVAEGRGLWFMGDVGTGKTTLAMLVSKAALDSGLSVAIYSLPHLLAEIRDTYDADPGERSYMDFFRRLVSVDLLHLEDLGAEKRTDWVLEQLYSLVNERYEERRSLIVTTNLDFGELEEQIGARTVSRIVEMCGDPLYLYGEDHRIALKPGGAHS
jgi:DNA replication protein DnaC